MTKKVERPVPWLCNKAIPDRACVILPHHHALQFLLQEFLHHFFVAGGDFHEIGQQSHGLEGVPIGRNLAGKQAPHTLRAVGVARQRLLQRFLAGHAAGIFTPQGFQLGAQGDLFAARLLQVAGGLRNGFRQLRERAGIALMLRKVSLQFRREPGMLSLATSLFRINTRRLALHRQSCLLGLHKLVAQLRRMADHCHQRLTAGFHVLFGGAELEGQVLLAHDHLGQRVLGRGKFLL